MSILIRLYRMIIVKIIRLYYKHKPNTNEAIMFMPHTSMSQLDLYDLFNYRSDSSLTFARFLLDNELLKDKEFIVFTPSNEAIEESYQKAGTLFPEKKITFISWDAFLVDYSKNDCFKKALLFCKCFARCSHVFTSITHRLDRFISNQIAVDLHYYPAPFKNDVQSKISKNNMRYDKVGKEYDKLIMTSEMGIRMEMAAVRGMDISQFADWGLCRNDNFFIDDSFNKIRERILSSVSYKANKIFLYTPTHRDYEQNVVDISRSLLGYSLDLNDFHHFLKSNGIVIVAKLHPKQNEKVISTQLPESIILHHRQPNYGLTELMIVSDVLITDYTSGYYDYLLLNKPVIFNFYDVELYKNERGFSFSPIESICAGEIVNSLEQFKRAMLNVEMNKEKYEEKRKFVRDLIFAYQDGSSCHRVYDHYFGA